MSLTVAAAVAAVVVDHTSINNIYLNILSVCINEECLSWLCVVVSECVCVCVCDHFHYDFYSPATRE